MSNQKQLKELTQIWYEKLKKSGFEDVEQDEDFLKQSSLSPLYKGQNKGKSFEEVLLLISSKEQYFRLTGHFLYDYKFDSKLEKLIWEDHCQGISHRDTADRLKKQGINNFGRTKVLAVIKKLRVAMYNLYRGSNEQE